MNNTKFLTLATVGTGLITTFTYLIHRLIKDYLYWNREFVKSGVIEELFIYPIKSCKGKKVLKYFLTT